MYNNGPPPYGKEKTCLLRRCCPTSILHTIYIYKLVYSIEINMCACLRVICMCILWYAYLAMYVYNVYSVCVCRLYTFMQLEFQQNGKQPRCS